MLIQRLLEYKINEKNLSKYKIAKILSTSPSNVYRYLKGYTGMLGSEKIISLGQLLDFEYYHLLIGIEPPKELIHFLERTNKELSFQKSLFYLSVLYDLQIYSRYDTREDLDSIVDTLGGFAGKSFNTTDEISIQFLADILLYSKNFPNQIIHEFTNSRLSDVYTYTNFESHQLTTSFNDLSTKIIKDEVKNKSSNDEEFDELAIALGFNPPSTNTKNILISIYRRRIDVYYLYINGNLEINEAENSLLQLDKIELKLAKPRFAELEFLIFEIFNQQRKFSSQINLIGGRVQARNLCMLKQLDPSGFEYSYEYITGLYPYLSKESNNHIIAVRINDESLNKIIHKNSYAVVELDNDDVNGHYALVSINNQTPLIAKTTILPEKILIEYNSNDTKKYIDTTYMKEEVKIFGKVIDYITQIK